MGVLEYRAGVRALSRVRERGFSLEDVRGFVLPAVGPRWLVASGFDRALVQTGFHVAPHEASKRPLLIGASAGSWRALALTAKDPARALDALIEAYCDQRFRRADTAAHVSGAYRGLLDSVFRDEDLAHALDHPSLDLALTVVRARGWGAQWARARMLAALTGAAALNLVSTEAAQWFFERVVFHTRRANALLEVFRGRRVPLSIENVRAAALASGTVPLYMEPVIELAGAGPGGYLDGGLADYHVNQPLRADGVILMFSHQARVVPGWFDKSLSWRRGPGTDDLVLAFPSRDWVAKLPGARVPTRDDFFEFEHTQDARTARWREVATRSDALGESFTNDLCAGRIADLVRPL
jgi:hypothetical protein